MWTATQDGFYSTVLDRDNPRHVLVRMRSEEDWKRARRRYWPLRMYRLRYNHTADYPWRASISKMAWRHYLARTVDDITYDDFKTRVTAVNGKERHNTYLDVWSTLHRIEDEPDSGVINEPRYSYGGDWADDDTAKWGVPGKYEDLWAKWREEDDRKAEQQRDDAAALDRWLDGHDGRTTDSLTVQERMELAGALTGRAIMSAAPVGDEVQTDSPPWMAAHAIREVCTYCRQPITFDADRHKWLAANLDWHCTIDPKFPVRSHEPDFIIKGATAPSIDLPDPDGGGYEPNAAVQRAIKRSVLTRR